MSEFCNKCTKEMYGKDATPDINVYEISSRLSPGYFMNVLCEGCEMVGIQKDERGDIYLLYPEMTKEGEEIKKVPLKEWEKKASIEISSSDNSGFIGGVQVGSPLDLYRLKIIKGINSKPQRYHVIQEYVDKNETKYSYLTEDEIIDKHNIVIKDKFDWITKQQMFVL